MKASEFASARLNVSPPHVTTIEPSDWRSDYHARKQTVVPVGFRRISEAEAQGATEEAVRLACRNLVVDKLQSDSESHSLAFNGCLMAIAVARAMCDPNDVGKPCESFPMAEDTIIYALTPPAIERLFHELQVTTLASGAAHRMADNDELAKLSCMLDRESLQALGREREGTVRRLLAYCLDEIEEANR